MKTKLTFLLVFCLLLAASCSPVFVDKLDSEDVVPRSSQLFIEPKGDGIITLKFTPIPYAKRYAYRINDDIDYREGGMTCRDGMYLFEDIPIGKNITGNASVFAQGDNSHSWILIATAAYALDLDRVMPDIYILRRNPNSVELKVDTNIEREKILYQIVVKKEDEAVSTSTYSLSSSNTLLIEGLEPSYEYSIEVKHKLQTSPSFSSATTTLGIKAYNPNEMIILKLESINGDLVLSGIPKNISTIVLAKYSDSTFSSPKILLERDIGNEGRAIFKAQDFKCLEAGYFFAYAKGNESEKSNAIKYSSPLRISEQKDNWQSSDFIIDFAEDVPDDARFTVAGYSSLKVEKNGNRVRITGMDSMCSYHGARLLPLDYPVDTGVDINIVTKSFAGVYEWRGRLSPNKNNPNFKVLVEKAPEGSSLSYYVFFHEEDDSKRDFGSFYQKYNDCLPLRVMPLIDTSMGEKPTPSAGVNLNSPGAWRRPNAAYVINGKKWNSTSTVPNSWKITRMDIRPDSVRTVVLSTTLIDFWVYVQKIEVNTTTCFDFKEIVAEDGSVSPVLIFTNYGDGLASVGIYKNASPNASLGENSNAFCLKRLGD